MDILRAVQGLFQSIGAIDWVAIFIAAGAMWALSRSQRTLPTVLIFLALLLFFRPGPLGAFLDSLPGYVADTVGAVFPTFKVWQTEADLQRGALNDTSVGNAETARQKAARDLETLCVSPDRNWVTAGWVSTTITVTTKTGVGNRQLTSAETQAAVKSLRDEYCVPGVDLTRLAKQTNVGAPLGTPPPDSQLPGGWWKDFVKTLFAIPMGIIAVVALFILVRGS